MSLIDEEELKIKIPSGTVISGATGSGKTSLLFRFIKNVETLFTPPPKEIIYCYGQMGPHVYKLQNMGITCVDGVPSEEILSNASRPYLLIFDDMMSIVSEKYLSDIFCKRSHHENFAVIFITQNLFDKNIRVARNNAQYILLTRSFNHLKPIHSLGSHLFPHQSSYFRAAFEDATEQPYGYLFIDLHAASRLILRLRTKIFPEDGDARIVYLPRANAV